MPSSPRRAWRLSSPGSRKPGSGFRRYDAVTRDIVNVARAVTTGL
nr:hypothetical protein [Actinoplanes polyasparticus]